jgi:hypothetical protein
MGERVPQEERSTSDTTGYAARGSAARLVLLAFVVFAPDLRVETARLATFDQPSPSKPVIPRTSLIIPQIAVTRTILCRREQDVVFLGEEAVPAMACEPGNP